MNRKHVWCHCHRRPHHRPSHIGFDAKNHYAHLESARLASKPARYTTRLAISSPPRNSRHHCRILFRMAAETLTRPLHFVQSLSRPVSILNVPAVAIRSRVGPNSSQRDCIQTPYPIVLIGCYESTLGSRRLSPMGVTRVLFLLQ